MRINSHFSLFLLFLAGTVPRTVAGIGAGVVPPNQCAPIPVIERSDVAKRAIYVNRQYGFTFSLPPAWRGFRVLACRWDGQRSESHDWEQGPLLLIRHPLYTDENPREDIPIMVFTAAQWPAVNNSDLDSALVVSAAPFPPEEIGRNRKYVFALPPRFSYDELDGVEEVLEILRGTPLRPIQTISHPRATKNGK